MTAQHLSVDELAEAAEGLLDPERAALAESHRAGCPDCQAQSEALREVTVLLVYTKSAGSTQVTVVTGCRVRTPSAGPSAVLPR
jgi:anti-sigma factor RsiW